MDVGYPLQDWYLSLAESYLDIDIRRVIMRSCMVPDADYKMKSL